MDYKSKFEEACRYVKRLTEEFNRLNIENCRLKDEKRALELRFNPYHDERGRFASGDITKRFSNGGAKPPIDNSSGKSYTEHEKDMKFLPQSKEYSEKIKGVVAFDGSIAQSVTCHAARRMEERNVPFEKVNDTVKNANISYPSGKHKNAKVIRKEDTQAVYSDDGAVITVINLGRD